MNIKETLAKMTLDQKIRLCTGRNDWQTMPFEELNIPPLTMSDGTNGIRFQKYELKDGKPKENVYDQVAISAFDDSCYMDITHKATCYPTGSALASSWNPNIAKEIGVAVANECKNFGIGLLLGPGMNIRRHPLTGRNFEYYSEDPVLSGEIAIGMVEGIQQEGVGATVKHFISNNSDTRRTKINCIIEERAAQEIYLAGFERVIKKAKPAAVMASYPAINGVHACQNEWLLTDILRTEWGYEGLTIADWGGVKDSVLAMNAGLDFQMPFSPWFNERISAAIQNGELSEEVIDAHCERILELVFKYSREGKENPPVNWDNQHDVAQRAAAECAVLLKNEANILPLDPQQKQNIALIGELVKTPLYQGTGCAIVNAMKVDIPYDEIHKVAPDVNFLYAPGYQPDDTTDEELLNEAVETAKSADVAIVMVGKRLPEESDYFDFDDMNLEPGHLRLLSEVLSVQPNTVVVLFNGDSVMMPWIKDAKAVLEMWYAGEGSGNAVAKLLFGLNNPSGKLPVSIPFSLSDTPAFLDFPHEQDVDRYREGIFVGYRYYDKREMEVLFPFGFGLSYTNFSYDEIKVVHAVNDNYQVEVKITNTGERAGAEVVQLYVSPDSKRVFRPIRELKGFEKVMLEPGESKTINFKLNSRDFAYYDDILGKWVVESGEYLVEVGTSSRDLPLNVQIDVKGDENLIQAFTLDSHYTDIFMNPAATKAYFDYLLEKGLLEPGVDLEDVKKFLVKLFWGFAQHLDNTKLPPEMVHELLDRMNAAIGK